MKFFDSKSKHTTIFLTNTVLQEDEIASTAAITRLRYPKDISLLGQAEIKFRNGEIKRIPFENLSEFSARNEAVNVEDTIEEVVAYFDSEFLKNGVEIVDTPGFNSTYEVHTEIAKSYVKKADASIFLFSYEKPGAKEEIKFLKYINDSMDRVFLVLNKIDLCNTSENTVEDTIEDLRNKLVKSGVFVEDKKIYPISAMLKKEGIKENSEKKTRASNFDKFSDELAEYLTSDENIKDRLSSPVNFIINELSNYKQELDLKIKDFNSDKEIIEKNIKEEEKTVEDLKNELKEKKKHIENLVKKALRKAKKVIEEKNEALKENINEDLKKINSQFTLKLNDFSDMNYEIELGMKRAWNSTKNILENDLTEVIDEIVDEEENIKDIEGKLITIINNGLNIEKLNLDEPEVNFDELDKIDSEVRELEYNYQDLKAKVANFINEKSKKTQYEEEVTELKEKLKRLENEKSTKLLSLGNGEIVQSKRTNTRTKKRGGLFGKIRDVLLGEKEVEYIETYEDDFNYKEVKRLKSEMNDEYDSKLSNMDRELEEKRLNLLNYADVDYKLNELNKDKERYKERYEKAINNKDEKKSAVEEMIITVAKNKYKRVLFTALDEFDENTKIFLDNNKNFITKVLIEALNEDKRKLQLHEEEVYNLYYAQASSPEILEKEIKDMYIKIDGINSDIGRLRDVKREVL
ncbi:dynamin family protein [Clostridium tarantellae]|uniref:dynamin family protein n=1 Tax=Clostridium tarantellae TaxID=39493 RepID=UPI001A9BA62D|nr:dynamin family protein [Clostridium tarantellae]